MKLQKLLRTSMLTVGITLVSITTNAQFGKGNWMVEGSVGSISFSNTDSKTESTSFLSQGEGKSFGISIYPKAGYFVTDNLAVGASIGLGFSNGSSENKNMNGVKTNEGDYSSTYASIGPFVRYYFKGSETLRFYLQGQGGYETDLSYKSDGKSFNGTTGVLQSSSSTDYTKNYNAVSYAFMGGMNYFLTSNVGLNMGLGYYGSSGSNNYITTYKNEITGVSTPNPEVISTNDRSSIMWSVGFTMILGKNKGADK